MNVSGPPQSLLSAGPFRRLSRPALPPLPAFLVPILLLTASGLLRAAVREARDPASLRQALASLQAGDTLKIHPGEYPGGNSVTGLSGLTIEAADPASPPHFKGGTLAWQFTRCPELTVRNLKCSGQSANGFNLDDGGASGPRVPHVILENLEVSDIGPEGNFDGIKCSGLTDLTIRSCSVSGWGGQAIDLVGCHRVLITGCRIAGKPGFSQHTGPQFKGGCEDIIMEHCTLIHAGQRPIQAGGSTGKDFYRPPGALHEARRVIIRENRITGGDCACAFTGVDGGEFTRNVIEYPDKWIFRILTETRTPGFPPARNIAIAGNIITYRRAQVRSAVNIGADTAPETFRFSGNHWHATDRPQDSKPELPVPETDARYGP